MSAPQETLPNAQAAVDEFLTVVKSSKQFVCSQCAGTGSASSSIKTGQMLRVDGSTGEVTILSAA